MPNMSYCRFENTTRDMEDCIYAIEERDVYEFSSYELAAFKDFLQIARTTPPLAVLSSFVIISPVRL